MPLKSFKLPVLFPFIFAILAAQQAYAAVTIDRASANGGSDTITGISTLTWQHTVSSCSNCAFYVRISTFTQLNIATARVQSVTYGTQALTAVGAQVSPFPMVPVTGNSSAEIYRLIAPATGTATVTVNFLTPVNYAVGSATSLNGVSQGAPNGIFSSTSGNSDSPAAVATDSVAGDLVLDALAASPNAIFMAEGPGQSACIDPFDESTCSRGRRFFGFSFDVGSMSTKPAVTPVTPVSWSMTSTSSWALATITVKQFVISAADVSVSGRVLSPEGRSVGRARVALTGAEGSTQAAMTNPFGYYRIGNVRAGETYLIAVESKSWQFQPKVLTITDDLSGVDFIAEPKSIGK